MPRRSLLVLVNAVFGHIPQPRDAHIREIWRVLAPRGKLLVNETPNKYLPVDFHTLHLPLTNSLPSPVAHRVVTSRSIAPCLRSGIRRELSSPAPRPGRRQRYFSTLL